MRLNLKNEFIFISLIVRALWVEKGLSKT